MTGYHFTTYFSLPPYVAARKAARKKIIERAQQLEWESYKALMPKRHQLKATFDLYTIV